MIPIKDNFICVYVIFRSLFKEEFKSVVSVRFIHFSAYFYHFVRFTEIYHFSICVYVHVWVYIYIYFFFFSFQSYILDASR